MMEINVIEEEQGYLYGSGKEGERIFHGTVDHPIEALAQLLADLQDFEDDNANDS